MAQLLPIFLKLAGRKVLVVGGGAVATAKVHALAPTGARLVVVAPVVSDAIRQSGARVHVRKFRSTDLQGVWLVVSAAIPAVNRAVSRAAERRRVFVNAVDDPQHASAYLGGVLRRGDLTVAISTGGRAPALAGLFREGLDALLPGAHELDRWFEEADALKQRWRGHGVPMEARRPELVEALTRLYADRRPVIDAGPEGPRG
jgi:uroporphyrin-III C-methyltransferase/precorrin-2 dehydrogenase/sirohydrochlorin ferrochelatase